MERVRVTYITGCAPLLSYARCMSMTDEEIRAYNEGFYRRETVEFELEPEGEPMTDIIERLEYEVKEGEESSPHSLIAAAITEIKSLRAKIEAISQVAGKASIDGVTFAQIKGRDSEVLGKYTPVNDALQKSMEQFQPVIAAKVLNDGE
jgi:hypothetical protein